MAEETSLLVKFLGDTPFARLIDFLIENRIFDYTKTELAENAGISRAALYKIWPTFERYDLVKQKRAIGNTILYALNLQNPLVQNLIELDLKLSKSYANRLETPVSN